MVSDYFATGEGSQLYILIGMGDDSIMAKRFEELFSDFHLKGAVIYDNFESVPLRISMAIPLMIKNVVDNYKNDFYFEWYSSLYINGS